MFHLPRIRPLVFRNHASNSCTKPKDVAPTCCNCGGEHTANYRGCPCLAKHKMEKTNSKTLTNLQNPKNTMFPSLPTTQVKLQLQSESNKNISYAKATINTQPTISIYKTIHIIQKLLESTQKCSDSNTKDDIISTILSIISELSNIQNE